MKVSLTGGAAASVCTSLPCFQYYKTDIEVYSREGNRVTLSAQPEDAIIGHLYHVTCDDVTAVAPCSCSVHHSVTVTSTGRRLDSRRLLAADSTRRLLAHSIADTTECAVHHCFEGDDGCRHPSAVSPETCLELDASGGCLQAACSLMVHNDYAYDVHIPAAGAAHRGRGLTTVEGSDIWDARSSELSVPGGGIEYQAPSESAWTTCRGAAYWLMAKYDVGDLDGDGNAEGINNDDSMKLCGNQELRAKFDRTVNCRELSNSTHCAAEELYEKSCFAQAPLVFFRARCHGVPCNARNAISAADKKKLCLRYHDMVGSCEWDSVRTMCKSCFPARATVLRPDGTRTPMEDLRVGDKVAVVNPATGEVMFDEVYTTAHAAADHVRPFVRIDAAAANGTATLLLSAAHLLFATPAKAPTVGNTWWGGAGTTSLRADVSDGKAALYRADQVRAGWTVFVHGHSTGALRPRTVAGVSVEYHRGLYAPHTLMHDTLLVDSVAASAFVDNTYGPELGRRLLMPFRALYRWLPITVSQAVASVLAWGTDIAPATIQPVAVSIMSPLVDVVAPVVGSQ